MMLDQPSFFSHRVRKSNKMLRRGEMCGSNHCVESFVGRGAESYCYKCSTLTDNQVVCVKVMRRKKFTKCFKQEIATLQQMKEADQTHPHIIQILAVIDDPDLVAYSMPICRLSLKSLVDRNWSKSFTHNYPVQKWLRQTTQAVRHLHNIGIVHRDVKLGNLLLARGGSDVVLADFGFAVRTEELSPSLKSVGTPNYTAPETIQHEPVPKLDMWAVGCCAFCMFVGVCPFVTSSVSQTIQRIVMCDWRFPTTASPTPAARSFCEALLCNPEDRMTPEKTLKHPYLTNPENFDSTKALATEKDGCQESSGVNQNQEILSDDE
jgi:polo-like kinase 1